MSRSIILSRAATAFAAVLGFFITFGTVAHAAPKVSDCTVSNSDGGDSTDSFKPNTAKIFGNCDVDDPAAGTKITTKWIAIDTNGVAPANYEIDTADFTLKDKQDEVDFSLSKPDNGFPVGKYRADIFVNGALGKSVTFSVAK